MYSLSFFFAVSLRVGEVDPRDSLVLPPLAKRILVVQETQFFYYIVHNQIGIDLWLVRHVLLVGLAQLADLVDVESLVWIYF